MAGIFKAYDIRGVYPEQINEGIARKIGLAYSTGFPELKREVVSMDYRKSSPAAQKELVHGLVEGGKDVFDLGSSSTPLFYFTVRHHGFDGGLMVTASHNPKEFNGVKVQGKNNESISWEKGLDKIEQVVKASAFARPDVKGKASALDYHAIEKEYLSFVSGRAGQGLGLKVVLDCGNGACGLVPEKALKAAGCEVETLYAEPDGDFPNHLADPHDAHTLGALQKRVVETRADLGLAFDGDGDRLGAVDEKGNVLTADQLLMLFTRQALSVKKGKCVFEVRCSDALFEDTRKHGGTPVMARVGHGYIPEELGENGVFGGELSGHLFFPYCYYNYDDAIFAALKLAEIAAASKPFSSRVASLPSYHASPEIFIDVKDEEKFALVGKIASSLAEKFEVDSTDGARVRTKNAWGLVRASNTTSHLKLRFEGRTREALEEVMDVFRKELGRLGLELKA